MKKQVTSECCTTTRPRTAPALQGSAGIGMVRSCAPMERRVRVALSILLLLATAAYRSDAFCMPSNQHFVVQQSQQQQQHSKARLILGPLQMSVIDSHTSSSSSSSSSSGAKKSPAELEYQMAVGHALDVLRNDYPYLLTRAPDFSIYDKNIEVVDPTGVTLHGITMYQNTFRLLHALVKFLYCPARSGLTFRMCYDQARQSIRIHWNAQVVPREIFGGYRQVLHVDGISVYEINRESGNITQHRIEQLLINDQPVMPKEGVIAALREEHGVTIPSFINMMNNNNMNHHANHYMLQFQEVNLLQRYYLTSSGHENKLEHHSSSSSSSSLFAMEASRTGDASGRSSDNTDALSSNIMMEDSGSSGSGSTSSALSSGSNSASGGAGPTELAIDWDAFEQKNKARKKFGLKPLSVEEFVALQTEVQKLDAERRIMMEQAAQEKLLQDLAKQQEQQQQQQQRGPNFLERFFDTVMKDTCESNYDCERPEICCDFGFKKMCCRSGSLVGSSIPQYALVPVPVGLEDKDPRQPPPRGGGLGGGGGGPYDRY